MVIQVDNSNLEGELTVTSKFESSRILNHFIEFPGPPEAVHFMIIQLY
jgi:hypothetical protein